MLSLTSLCGCGGPDNSPPVGNIPGTPNTGRTADATTGAGDVTAKQLANAPESAGTVVPPNGVPLPDPALEVNKDQMPMIRTQAQPPLTFAGSGAHVKIPFFGGSKDSFEEPLVPPIDIESGDAWHEVGYRYQLKEKKFLAAFCYEKAVELNPNQKGFWSDLGSQYQGIPKPESARLAFIKACELDVMDLYNICSVGYNDSMQTKDDEAFRYYCMALSIEPSHQDAWNQLISILHRLDRERFIRDIQKLADNGQNPINVHVALALIDEYLQEHPDDYDFLVDRGFLMTRLMRIDEARRAFQRALKQRPDGVRCLIGMGLLYDTEGKREKAKETFLKVLDLSPTQATAWAALGAISAAEGNYKQAVNEYHSALKLTPSNSFWSEQTGYLNSLVKKQESEKGKDAAEKKTAG